MELMDRPLAISITVLWCGDISRSMEEAVMKGGTSYPGVLIGLKCIRFQGIGSSLDMTMDAAYSDVKSKLTNTDCCRL